jgi:nicotinamidase-related amidase
MQRCGLIDADDSVLLVVDVQDNFICKLEPTSRRALLERVCWLVGVARWLDIPILVTVEDLEAVGGPSPQVSEVLPPGTPVLNKMVFGLADQPDILAHVAQTGRRTAVLVGLETDVCIMQSALSLLAHGFFPVVVSDASGSPGDAHAAGLARLRDAGVLVTHTKGLFYEWMRTVERSRRFEVECVSLQAPVGLTL